PGALMCGRHTAAFLTVMDLPELIASSVEDYEQKASQLGLDPLFRRKMSDLVQKRVNRCHAGQQALHTLQDFLERTAQTY
ncbi:MAG: hypothetical protein KKB70_06035, partial [Proteobacteria bacterium]|nr:hypothetical protein [Pseudomonadota bacterium]MBU1611183.1 hypothetical protein [Pseudomonadota bacterium]